MLIEIVPAAMIGIEDVTELLGLAPALARTYLKSRDEEPLRSITVANFGCPTPCTRSLRPRAAR
jgi:hypothetical protein